MIDLNCQWRVRFLCDAKSGNPYHVHHICSRRHRTREAQRRDGQEARTWGDPLSPTARVGVWITGHRTETVEWWRTSPFPYGDAPAVTDSSCPSAETVVVPNAAPFCHGRT
jgi:hypothetical protein